MDAASAAWCAADGGRRTLASFAACSAARVASDLATDPGVPPISSTSFKSPVSSMVNPAIFASTTRAFLADAVG